MKYPKPPQLWEAQAMYILCKASAAMGTCTCHTMEQRKLIWACTQYNTGHALINIWYVYYIDQCIMYTPQKQYLLKPQDVKQNSIGHSGFHLDFRTSRRKPHLFCIPFATPKRARRPVHCKCQMLAWSRSLGIRSKNMPNEHLPVNLDAFCI